MADLPPFSVKVRRILLTAGLTAFFAVTVITALIEAGEVRNDIAPRMTSLAATSAGLLYDHVLEHSEYIEKIIRQAPAGDDKTVVRYFSARLPLFGPEDHFFLLDGNRRVIHTGETYREFIGLDFSNRDSVRQDRRISRVHQSLVSLKPVVTIRYPLPENRLLLVEKSLADLIPHVRHLNLGGLSENALLFILTEGGTVVYHPDRELMASRHNLGFELKNRSTADKRGLQTYTHQGVKYLCFKTDLPVPAGWTFYVAVPASEVNGAVLERLTRQSVFFACIFITLIVALEVLVNRRVSLPVSRVANFLAGLDPMTGKGNLPNMDRAGSVEIARINEATRRLVGNIRQANEKLRQSEELFRTVTEFASDWVFWVNPDREPVYISPSCLQVTGYSPEEIHNAPQLSRAMVHPDDLGIYDEHVNTSEKGASQKGIEYRIRTKEGEARWVSHVCRAIFNEAGEYLGLRGSITDITGKKQAQAELAREKELLGVTLRSIGDGVIATDTEGSVVLLSKAAESLTGWAQQEAIGRPLPEVFPAVNPMSRQPLENLAQKVLETGSSAGLAGNTLLVAGDGSERIIAASAAPIRDRESRVIGVVLVFRDVTEQHRMEEESRKAQRLESLGVLAGGIAHDFNNLLAAILGNISLANLDAPPDSKMAKQLKAAEKATFQARNLTLQLQTFAKGGAPVKQAASLKEIIKDSADFSLRGSNVKLELALDENLWPVEVDPGQISQVINNLMINADQAMPEGGVVRVTGRNFTVKDADGPPLAPGPYVAVTVGDEGGGIDEQHLQKIFDPYFTTKKQGAGLGLASSYSIAKRHGGLITVSSEPGKGTAFALYLPALPSNRVAEPSGPPGPPGEPLPGKGKILVMDDEEIVRNMTRAGLHYLGYEMTPAEDGVEALKLYAAAMQQGEPFSAVIMDLTIPGGMGGKEAVTELLQLDPEARVIVSSGYAQDPIMADYLKHGFCGVLTKPYSVMELSRVLHELLAREEKGL